jgi:hypothetical protein
MAKRVQKLAKTAQEAGLMNAALDPRLVIVSLIGLTLLPLAAAPIWQQLPGYQTISVERMAAHMLELLAHGLEYTVDAPRKNAGSASKRRAARPRSSGEKKHAARSA